MSASTTWGVPAPIRYLTAEDGNEGINPILPDDPIYDEAQFEQVINPKDNPLDLSKRHYFITPSGAERNIQTKEREA